MTVRKRKSQKHTKLEHDDAERNGRSSRRAWIMRGVVTPILGLLAVICIALGIVNATIWKPSSEITADATVKGSRYIVTDPGVLPLVDERSQVTVTAASDENICVVLGSGKDVNGWISGESYTRISGLENWTTLAVTKQKANDSTGAQGQDGKSDGSGDQSGDSSADQVAIADSDMWTKSKCDAGKVTLSSTVKDSATMALIDLGENAKSGTVSIRWHRQTLPDFAMPFYFAGGLLALMGVLAASVFAMPPHKRRKRIVESKPVVEEVSISEALTGSLAVFKPSKKPRRQSGQPRRRHATPAQSTTQSSAQSVPNDAEETQLIGSVEPLLNPPRPTIIDPMARNLVADAAGQTSADGAFDGVPGGASQLSGMASIGSNTNVPPVSGEPSSEVPPLLEPSGAFGAADSSAASSASEPAASSVPVSLSVPEPPKTAEKPGLDVPPPPKTGGTGRHRHASAHRGLQVPSLDFSDISGPVVPVGGAPRHGTSRTNPPRTNPLSDWPDTDASSMASTAGNTGNTAGTADTGRSVADNAAAAGTAAKPDGDGNAVGAPQEAATSIITQDELQAYFARLAQESTDDANGAN